jgi:serine protease Do
MAGEVVGINTAIFSQSGGNIGIGFAVPATW